MTFVDSVRTCLSKFVTWQGRAPRSEFWWFALCNVLVLVVGALLDNTLGTTFKMSDPMTGEEMSIGYGWFYVLGALGMFLPYLSVIVRRLHDTGRSGWWYWIALIPLIGGILLLVWFCSRGTNGENKYGSDPLGGDLGQVFS